MKPKGSTSLVRQLFQIRLHTKMERFLLLKVLQTHHPSNLTKKINASRMLLYPKMLKDWVLHLILVQRPSSQGQKHHRTYRRNTVLIVQHNETAGSTIGTSVALASPSLFTKPARVASTHTDAAPEARGAELPQRHNEPPSKQQKSGHFHESSFLLLAAH